MGSNRRNRAYNTKVSVPDLAKRDLLERLKTRVDTAAATEAAQRPLSLAGYRFEELLERRERIFVIETQDLGGTLNQFQTFARRSGKAVYLWRGKEGLRSLKVSDMGVPGSERVLDALRYIAGSPHYGVYGFIEFERGLDLSGIQVLKQIATARSGYDRKVFLIGEQIKLPKMMADLVTRIEHQPARRLRLRDGRWVV